MKDASKIPKGPYCYTTDGIFKGTTLKIKICPYWDKVKNAPEQENGYCHYLDEGDFDDGPCFLLWDQVKECGVNDDWTDQ